MEKEKQKNGAAPEKEFFGPYDFHAKLPLGQAIPLGLQHVLAMFVGNLTPILIITSACAAMSDAEQFAAIQVSLLQNAMLIAGIVTLVQLFAIGPIGGKVPIIMGTSSGFIGVFQSVVNVMGGGVAPHYLMIVDRENNMDVLTVMVEVDERYFSDEIRKLDELKNRVAAVLKQALGVSVRVKLVEPKTIQRSEGKAKRVIDNRQM